MRRLTADGQKSFATWLEQGTGETPPESLLDGDLTEDGLAAEVDESMVFQNRFEFGSYLTNQLATVDFVRLMSIAEDGTWDWLSVVYFSQIRKRAKKTGRFQSVEHFIVTRKGLKGSLAYRQAARTSFELVRFHGSAAKVCLLRAMNTFGDTAEQLASRNYLARNSALFGAAATLYLRGDAVVKGASSYPTPPKKRKKGDRKGYGGLRRLQIQLGRLQLTYDTGDMSSQDLVALLPREFDKHTAAAEAA